MAAKDEKAPAALQVIIQDGNGKLNNPDNLTSRYQCGLTFTLIGSKEKA